MGFAASSKMAARIPRRSATSAWPISTASSVQRLFRRRRRALRPHFGKNASSPFSPSSRGSTAPGPPPSAPGSANSPSNPPPGCGRDLRLPGSRRLRGPLTSSGPGSSRRSRPGARREEGRSPVGATGASSQRERGDGRPVPGPPRGEGLRARLNAFTGALDRLRRGARHHLPAAVPTELSRT